LPATLLDYTLAGNSPPCILTLSRVLYGDNEGTLHLLEIVDNRLQVIFSQKVHKSISAVSSIKPNVVATGCKETLALWRITENKFEKISEVDAEGVFDIIVLPESRIAHRTFVNEVRIWDLTNFSEVTTLKWETQIHDCRVSADGSRLISLSCFGDIIFRNPENFEVQDVFSLEAPVQKYFHTIHELAENIFLLKGPKELLVVDSRAKKILWREVIVNFDACCVLPNGVFVAACSANHLLIYPSYKWNYYKWVFLGHSDQNSYFFKFPIEIIFQFVVTTHNIGGHLKFPHRR
jgi:WD40 repeat protein